MTPQNVLTQLNDFARLAQERAEKARSRSCSEAHFEGQVQAYLHAARLVGELIPVNENVTADDLRDVAQKFRVAGNGDGPGITVEVLAQIGLGPKPKPERSYQETWESMCQYVWNKFTHEPWPGSPARGRGRHSRDVARLVADLLEAEAAKREEVAA